MDDNDRHISYRFDEERDFLFFYAKRLNNRRAYDILNKGYVSDAEEAEILSRFFWQMVDQTVEDDKQDIKWPFSAGSEFWCEKTLNSLSGHLYRAGYEAIWERISDEQD